MCIRDSDDCVGAGLGRQFRVFDIHDALENELAAPALLDPCLLYTSDAADERSSVDLGGRRIITKKQCIESVLCRRAPTSIRVYGRLLGAYTQ